ncbi:hypothetical protein B0H14DRAFT_659429 [Mycena olivaceomarginata]|nr:hypothetical protein B0H14DRAFT_659429 [Mycena olivaceomarginata]
MPASEQSQSGDFMNGYRRSRSVSLPTSWGNNANPWLNSAPPAPQIHPWIDGDAPSPIFYFDLADSAFTPRRFLTTNQTLSAILSLAEFQQPAFHPPLTALRIIHPRIPSWPVDLELPTELVTEAPKPITLGDVLIALHRAMHQRITYSYWAMLSLEDEQAVSNAFTDRCRTETMPSGVPERSQGVKRVDFLLGETMFKGLILMFYFLFIRYCWLFQVCMMPTGDHPLLYASSHMFCILACVWPFLRSGYWSLCELSWRLGCNPPVC